MSGFMQQSRKYGTKITDADGRIIELHGKIKLGQDVTWLGRKVGSGTNVSCFEVGQRYKVCFIYDNGDIELQGDSPEITTRASDSEYGK